ncbi:MAG: hypothetical protein RJA87_2127 [Pseudomonadota bacterium]
MPEFGWRHAARGLHPLGRYHPTASTQLALGIGWRNRAIRRLSNGGCCGLSVLAHLWLACALAPRLFDQSEHISDVTERQRGLIDGLEPLFLKKDFRNVAVDEFAANLSERKCFATL